MRSASLAGQQRGVPIPPLSSVSLAAGRGPRSSTLRRPAFDVRRGGVSRGGRTLLYVRAQRAQRVEGGVKVYDKVVESSALKGIQLQSADGACLTLEEIIGTEPSKKAVVVFLRHLG